MVKAYLRYEAEAAFGVICSGNSLAYGPEGQSIVTAALEKIIIWNLRSGEQVKSFCPPVTGPRLPEVTCLALSPDQAKIAAGYSDGSVRLWDFRSGDSEPPASGHKTAVTVLRYSSDGSLLASGGQDTNVVVWDVTSMIPLHRLQGHLGQITSLVFLQDDRVIVSSSKDGYIRAWELSSQHCFQTLGGQHGEVWSLDANSDADTVVVGFSTPVLEVLQVDVASDQEADNSRVLLKSLGTVQRATTDRAAQILFSPSSQLVACLGAGKAVELFRIRTETEVKQKLKRRKKRKREKLSKGAGEDDGVQLQNGHQDNEDETVTAADLLSSFQVIRTKSKVKAIAFAPRKAKSELASISLALGSNAVEVWSIGEEKCEKQHSIDGSGHRSGIRAVALANDSTLLLSAAESSVKVWNARSLACLRTLDVANGLCLMFAPGNRHAVVGTKEGKLELMDLGSGDVIESIEAHKGAVWAATPLPDNSGLVSGSADHEAKFWEWEVREEEQGNGPPRRVLGLRHTRTIKMQDDILAVKITPDGRLIALSLLDSTIQILFLDTLKLKGSLYGHKLPVLSMDISSDSTLLVTGSADKNIKIWGLDFNDCHKSIFAHNDSIMQVSFVPNTHYVFTVSKDRSVKYWDADRWELLLELSGHHAEVWCLAVSSLGDMVVTGSADRSIRLWERTDEPFFAEEERENRIESLFEAEQPNPHVEVRRAEGDGPGEAKAVLAGLDNPGARAAVDNLADALEDAAKEQQRLQEFNEGRESPTDAPPNPMMLGLTPTQYVLRSLTNIRSSDLEQALLLLPFNYALDLLGYLCYWLEKGVKVELSCRVAVLVVRLHHQQLVATPSVRPTLVKVQELLHGGIKKKKDLLGFNLAGMQQLLRMIKQQKAQL